MTSFTFSGNVFTPHPIAWQQFTQSGDGEVGRYLKNRARALTSLAKAGAPVDHGALRASIGWSYHPMPNPYVRIGSNLSYAYYVHEGTKPHVIMPAPGKVVRFTVRGRVVYAQEVHHPGTRPQRYLSDHLRKVIR